MKDQFANYVVQKLLEVCDEGERDQLLSRMQVHLPNLKKFTYGKHIVARVEKLIQSNLPPPRPITAVAGTADGTGGDEAEEGAPEGGGGGGDAAEESPTPVTE